MVGRGSHLKVGKFVHTKLGEHVLGVRANLDGLDVHLRLVRDIVHTALALFLLKLERDSADGATLDA